MGVDVDEFVDVLFLLNKISWRGILEFRVVKKLRSNSPGTKRGGGKGMTSKRLRWGMRSAENDWKR